MLILRRLLLLCLLLLAAPSNGQQESGADPVLLVASTELQDPNFAHSVVLVLFPAGGSPTGVILNRPTRLAWSEAFPDEPALRARADPIYFGGPVRINALWFLFRQGTPQGNVLPVLDDLYLSSDGELLDRLLETHAPVDRFFVGYSGWAPAQLDMEIAQGAWHVLPADLDVILKMDPETMWRELLLRATAVKT
jgi:putative transcriptional regulator